MFSMARCTPLATLTFHNEKTGRYDLHHPSRALMCMEGEARYTNTHCILPRARDEDEEGVTWSRFTRYALTFRYVPTKHLSHLL